MASQPLPIVIGKVNSFPNYMYDYATSEVNSKSAGREGSIFTGRDEILQDKVLSVPRW